MDCVDPNGAIEQVLRSSVKPCGPGKNIVDSPESRFDNETLRDRGDGADEGRDAVIRRSSEYQHGVCSFELRRIVTSNLSRFANPLP